MAETGTVYLIGAGPGDPGLMTIRGMEVLGKADVVVYDYLVNPRLLALTRTDAEIIYVGKKAGSKEKSQGEINRLLIERARKGKSVARLKGGDPFVFGRGGEEAEALSKKGIPFEIVPGVTSASAVPAYAGIPLTHRDITSSFAVVTGHEYPQKERSNVPWDVLAKIGTVVFLMGMRNIEKNMRMLMDHGKPPGTPAAVITWGTYPSQTVATGTVGSIACVVKKRKDISSPAIVVVGDVVNLRDVINWYERKPLFGKRILVTRAREQSEPFLRMLEENGAEVIELPVIEIVPPRSCEDLDRAIESVRDYDWLVFTSVNGVAKFFERLTGSGKDVRELYGLRIAAIGEATAGEIEKKGVRVELLPVEYRAEGLIEMFGKENMMGKRVLLPRAKEARDVLPAKLREMGARVDVVTAYETTRPGKQAAARIKSMLAKNMIDAVTFTSSSTVRNFLSIFPGFKPSRGKPALACIGPITAKTLSDAGFKARITPAEYTVEKLALAIAAYFEERKPKKRK
jgi:uroporphyrinogen III methyltransferase/synthase